MSEQTVIPPATEPYVLDGILFNDDARMTVWVQERLGVSVPVATMTRAFGMIRGDRIVAGAYFYDYYNKEDISDITLAAAMDVPVTDCRDGMKRVFQYPFVELGLRRVSAEIELANRKAVDQAQLIGFVMEGVKRFKGKGGSDVGVFGLYPNNCVFLKG